MIAASAPGWSWTATLKARDPPLANEVADEDVGEQMGVDVPAAQDGRDLLAAESLGVGEHRGEAGRACPFDHGLLDPDEHRDGALEVAFGNQHDIVRVFLEDSRRQLARLLDRDAFGERVAAQRHVAALDRAFHRGIELGLDSDQLDVRLHRAGGDRDSRT